MIKNRAFPLIFGGQLISTIGTRLDALVLPTLAILMLGAGPEEVGVLTALETGPWLLLSIPAGILVDRIPNRPLMVVCDLARALAVGSLPFAALVLGHHISILQINVVVGLVAVMTVPYDTAYQTQLQRVFETDKLLTATSRLTAVDTVGWSLGPGLGGILMSAIGATATILVDAASYLTSAFSWILVGRGPEHPVERYVASSQRHGSRSVLSFVLKQRSLIVVMFVGVGFNAGLVIAEVNLLPYAYTRLGLGVGTMGIAAAIASAVSTVGILISSVARRRSQVRLTMLGGTVFGAAGWLLILFAQQGLPVLWIIVGLAVQGTATVTMVVLITNIRTTLVPPAMMGRVLGFTRTINVGTIPISAIAGGWLGAKVGPAEAIGIGGAIILVTMIPLVIGRLPQHIKEPENYRAVAVVNQALDRLAVTRGARDYLKTLSEIGTEHEIDPELIRRAAKGPR